MFSGCDFLPLEVSIKGFGIGRAYTMIKKHRNLERVLSLLQRDKKKYTVPPGFAASFWKAIHTFKYARGESVVHSSVGCESDCRVGTGRQKMVLERWTNPKRFASNVIM